MDPEGIPGRTGVGVAQDSAGGRERARAGLAALLDEIHQHGEAIHRCMLAHYLADTQEDPSVTGEPARKYFPSQPLNLAEDYRKLGDWDAACEHPAMAVVLAGALPQNGSRDMIRGIAGVAAQI